MQRVPFCLCKMKSAHSRRGGARGPCGMGPLGYARANGSDGAGLRVLESAKMEIASRVCGGSVEGVRRVCGGDVEGNL